MHFTITLNVTSRHIETGIPRKCSACPIATALAEVVSRALGFKNYDSIAAEFVQSSATPSILYVNIFDRDTGRNILFQNIVDQPVSEFMGNFDTHVKVKPFKAILQFAPVMNYELGKDRKAIRNIVGTISGKRNA